MTNEIDWRSVNFFIFEFVIFGLGFYIRESKVSEEA